MSFNENSLLLLFKDKANCSACGACLNICTVNAISMQEDEYGFLYPSIDMKKCTKCNACMSVCAYKSKKNESTDLEQAYVAVSNSEKILKKSASGGVFAQLATEVIKDSDGMVFGCSLEYENGEFCPKHVGIESLADLQKLQSSKYIQSDIGHIYRLVKEKLKDNRVVLFSGVPCQIDGLYGYLGKSYENLYTIDIICHGCPSSKFFLDYIKYLEKRKEIKIDSFNFRDKSISWGLTYTYTYTYTCRKTGERRLERNASYLSSYYKLFLAGLIYRDSCYSCKYATKKRVGDITIGDYWGIEEMHPEFLLSAGGEIDAKKGISCILVNTVQGEKILEKFASNLNLKKSELAKVVKNNHQLKFPTQKPINREAVLSAYKKYGYKGVEKWCVKKFGIKHFLKGLIPKKIFEVIKKFLLRK